MRLNQGTLSLSTRITSIHSGPQILLRNFEVTAHHIGALQNVASWPVIIFRYKPN